MILDHSLDVCVIELHAGKFRQSVVRSLVGLAECLWEGNVFFCCYVLEFIAHLLVVICHAFAKGLDGIAASLVLCQFAQLHFCYSPERGTRGKPVVSTGFLPGCLGLLSRSLSKRRHSSPDHVGGCKQRNESCNSKAVTVIREIAGWHGPPRAVPLSVSPPRFSRQSIGSCISGFAQEI